MIGKILQDFYFKTLFVHSCEFFKFLLHSLVADERYFPLILFLYFFFLFNFSLVLHKNKRTEFFFTFKKLNFYFFLYGIFLNLFEDSFRVFENMFVFCARCMEKSGKFFVSRCSVHNLTDSLLLARCWVEYLFAFSSEELIIIFTNSERKKITRSLVFCLNGKWNRDFY